jgi:tetratricopeptide (TPR) repeat protein
LPISLATLARGAVVAAALGAAVPAPASTLSGAYLAAMQADFRNDYAAAADYYDRALDADPGNVGLLVNAVVTRVALGDVPGARALADRLAERDPANQAAALVRLADALAAEDFAAAEAALAAPGEEANPLLSGLIAGWIEVGRDNFAGAQERFDAMTGNEALAAFGQYHKALALALAGDFVSAEAILAGGEDGPLHLNRAALVAHAQILAQIDRGADAVTILNEALGDGVPDAPLIALRDRLAAGEEVVFDQATSARDGAAEAFLTLAEALDTEDSLRIALVHARLAAHIRPGFIEAQLLAGELLEAQQQFELAAAALAGVPEESPWYVTAQIRRAATQSGAGDPEGGIATLTALGESHPDQIEVHSALGDALRAAERYPEAAAAYGKAIALIDGAPRQAHWVLYYTRAISYERAGEWAAAEADFRQALALEPEQPMVLNYLGYSLVEQHRDLDEALDMIERAVKGQPDDGYITDSLGWVLYRLGRYDEAVPHMLRAVELTPDDPVINDHLGDVLWMVGRHREAEFQWRRALSFGPADDLDMDRIRQKLDTGLDAVLAAERAETDG